MPFGPHFFIQNNLTGTALQVKKGEDSRQTQPISTGHLVQMFQENDHQLWLYDKDTQTIRSKVNGLCLDVQDSDGLQQVFISPYQAGKDSQCWALTEDQIQMNSDFEMVISLVSEEPVVAEEGGEEAAAAAVDLSIGGNTQVIVSQNTNHESQLWKIAHAQTEFFHIISQADNKAVDVKAGNPKAGSELIMYAKWPEPKDNQLWYQDTNGVIRSKMNDFALTAATETVTLQPYTEHEHQQWTISGSRIQSQPDDDKVLEAKQGYFSTYLSAATYSAAPNQHWFFEYPEDQAISLNHSGAGKFAFLRCRLSGAVITVAAESQDPGTPVIVAGQRPDTENCDDQLWFFEPISGVLRSALNGFCFDMDENHKFVINPHDPFSKNQQWTMKAGTIRNRHNLKYVLQMTVTEEGACELKGAAIIEDDESQIWDVEHVAASSVYVRNSETDLVLTVKESKSSSGAVIMMPKQKTVTLRQLWYEDENGIIRSKLNGYTIDTQESGIAKIRPHNPKNKKQMWTVVGDRLQNKHEQKVVLDVKSGSKEDGVAVIEYKFHGGDNQRWQFDYVDV